MSPCLARQKLMKYDQLLKHELLSPAEERQLIIDAQSGDETARERLILLNLRLVNHVARGYARPDMGVSAEDLIADGVQGLIAAIDHFDVELGHRFSTYAYFTIQLKIGRSELLNEMIRIPQHIRERQGKIQKAKRALAASGIYEPTFEQISEASGVSLEHVELDALLNETVINVVSLDAPRSENSDITLADIIPAQETDINLEEIKSDLEWFLSLLPDLERFVLTRAYGIPVKLTLAEIGARLGRSREWAALVRDRALESLQRVGRALKGTIRQAYEALNNPSRLMKLNPTNVPEGISFVDGEVVKKEPISTNDTQLHFDF